MSPISHPHNHLYTFSFPYTHITSLSYPHLIVHLSPVHHPPGIIHSDLKPANFLLVDGTVKLIDFGISSSIQNDMTSVIKDSQVGDTDGG